jgi:hypothetical protein
MLPNGTRLSFSVIASSSAASRKREFATDVYGTSSITLLSVRLMAFTPYGLTILDLCGHVVTLQTLPTSGPH